jgi:hypothetical protein
MTNGHEMFHHPGRSLRFPTKEGIRAPLLLGGATLPTTMSPNGGSSSCCSASPHLGCSSALVVERHHLGQDSLS